MKEEEGKVTVKNDGVEEGGGGGKWGRGQREKDNQEVGGNGEAVKRNNEYDGGMKARVTNREEE